jgi:hypothetical protein
MSMLLAHLLDSVHHPIVRHNNIWRIYKEAIESQVCISSPVEWKSEYFVIMSL